MTHDLLVVFAMVALYCLWIVGPLVPSILIYKLFPDTKVAVKGPLSGLTVRASGAFGAYLVVFLVAFPLQARTYNTVGGLLKPVWTINAMVEQRDTHGQPVTATDLKQQLSISLEPSIHNVSGNHVRLQIPAIEGNWPLISFKVASFGGKTINLAEVLPDAEIDRYHKSLTLHVPVVIRQLEPVGGGGRGPLTAIPSGPTGP